MKKTAHLFVEKVVLKIFIFSLLNIFSLHANLPSLKKQDSHNEKELINSILAYEHAGDFTSALKIARHIKSDLLQKGFLEETYCSNTTINRLEQKLLSLGYSKLLFDENYLPRCKLLSLLELLGMEPCKNLETLLQINNWAQKNLLRQGERWQAQSERFESLQSKLLPLLSDLNFVEGSSSHFSEYEGALLYGGLLKIVRIRLHHLVTQWNNGVRFSKLYFLCGERPLEPQYENQMTLVQDEGLLKIRKDWIFPTKLPTTECEMMQLVWDQSEIPQTMREEVKVHFIQAPMKYDPKNGKNIRPTTDDTIEYWLKTKPLYGCYLAVTNAPYINRQDLVVRTIAPEGYCFDTIGAPASEEEKMAIYLDEVARSIFQTKLLSERK